MDQIPRFDSKDSLSWARTVSAPQNLKKFRLDLLTRRGWCTVLGGAALIFLAYILGRHEMMALGTGLIALVLVSWILVLRLRNTSSLTRTLLSPNPVVRDITRVQLTCADQATVQEGLP